MPQCFKFRNLFERAFRKVEKMLFPMPLSIPSVPAGNVNFRGDYPSWEDVSKLARGYNESSILEKVISATRQVADNPALYERDSVVFQEYQYSWPLLAHIMWIAHRYDSQLKLIDFGGSLGSTYYQNRHFLKELNEVFWAVVEQSHFVDVGQKNFQNVSLKFFHTVEEVLRQTDINVLLLSGSLQYLPDPYEWLDRFINFNFDFILLDRTSVLPGERDRLTLQTVPAQIYEASYPAWFLSENKLKERFAGKYELISEFPAFVGDQTFIDGLVQAGDKGFVFKKKGLA